MVLHIKNGEGMKKIILTISIVFCLLISVSTIYAENTDQTEIIVDEQTPLAKGPTSSNLLVPALLLSATGIIVIMVITSINKERLKLIIDEVDENSDGTYTVKGGYQSLGFYKDLQDLKDSRVNVTKGTAIFLKKLNPNDLNKNKMQGAFVTVINDESEIEWLVGEKKMIINKKVIEKEGRKHV